MRFDKLWRRRCLHLRAYHRHQVGLQRNPIDDGQPTVGLRQDLQTTAKRLHLALLPMEVDADRRLQTELATLIVGGCQIQLLGFARPDALATEYAGATLRVKLAGGQHAAGEIPILAVQINPRGFAFVQQSNRDCRFFTRHCRFLKHARIPEIN